MKEFYSKNDPQAGEKFEKWRQSHKRAYVINYGGPSNARLHFAGCDHFIFYIDVDLAAKRKICFLDQQALKKWLHGKSIKLDRCNSCKS